MGPNDRVAIDIFNVPEFSGEQQILTDGTVSLSLLGRVVPGAVVVPGNVGTAPSVGDDAGGLLGREGVSVVGLSMVDGSGTGGNVSSCAPTESGWPKEAAVMRQAKAVAELSRLKGFDWIAMTKASELVIDVTAYFR